MAVEQVQIGSLSVSRLIIGGNPFSGFSHQGSERDLEMKYYYSTEHIKQALRDAEELGINTHIGRADHHVIRTLLEYWHEGGKIQWFAQTCPELGEISNGINNAIGGGAKACYIHGGQMDFLLHQGRLDEVPAEIERIRAAGLVAGVAGHNPKVFEWADKNIDVDFYMCAYYNPTFRGGDPEHHVDAEEVFDPADRDKMTSVIKNLSKPVIHYKVLAAGRNDPKQAFTYVAEHMRSGDVVCVGVFMKDNPQMLKDDIDMLTDSMRKAGV